MNAKKRCSTAFAELMQGHSFDDISIDMILKEADVSRSTFYRHFRDKYDLLTWSYFENTKSFLWNSNHPTYEYILKDLCVFLKDNYAFYKKAYTIEGTNSFSESLYQTSIRMAVERYHKIHHTDEVPLKDRIMFEYGAKGTLWIIEQWIQKGAVEKPEDIAHYIYLSFSDEYRMFVDDALHDMN